MDKERVVEKLKKKGYEVTLSGNVPMVRLENWGAELKKLRALLETMDYHGSYGYIKDTSAKAGKAVAAESAEEEAEEIEADEESDAQTDRKADEESDAQTDRKADEESDAETDLRADGKSDVEADLKADTSADDFGLDDAGFESYGQSTLFDMTMDDDGQMSLF